MVGLVFTLLLGLAVANVFAIFAIAVGLAVCLALALRAIVVLALDSKFCALLLRFVVVASVLAGMLLFRRMCKLLSRECLR